MIIGIDLDNTIINYSQSFLFVAEKLKLLSKDQLKNTDITKDRLKKYFIEKKRKKDWEFLQGQVYGKYIHYSSIEDYFYDFLFFCKLNKYEILIISHKTSKPHHDIEKINLHNSAINFLLKKILLEKDLVY